MKGLIEELRATDTALRVAGADSHRYDIGPSLSEATIRDFETTHAITLPVEYRLYLQLVGNGSGRQPPSSRRFVAGAGPGYGLYPLAFTVNGTRVSQPFPFDAEVELPDEPPYDDWDDDAPGTLEIGTSGCTTHTRLIVSGPQFGTIWKGHDYYHFCPTNLCFIQWMRHWAERALSILAYEPLIDNLAVGMTKAEVMATVGGEWQERESPFLEKNFFEAPDVPVSILLSRENGVVTKIVRLPIV